MCSYKSTLVLALLALPAMATPAGYFQVPGTDTTLKLYGHLELREAHGFNGDGLNTDLTQRAAGDQDTLQRGEWSGNWRTFLGVTTTTPSPFGDIATKIEGRFRSDDTGNGQSVLFNMEHAYVSIGGFLAGTSTSLFGYGAWEPNTLFGCFSDENGPWLRVRQITYTGSPTKGLVLGVSLEGQNDYSKPNANFLNYQAPDPSKGTSGNDLTKQASNGTVPNVSAVAAYTADWGGLTAAINLQQAKTWSLSGGERSGQGLSWALSGGWNITAADQLTTMIMKAGANYGAGNDGFYSDPTDAGSFGFYASLAYNVSYTHTWNDQLSTALTVGQVKWNQDSGAQVPDDYKLTEFILSNTWQISRTTSLGVEYQHAQMKASNSMPFGTELGGFTDTNKLDQLRFLVKATLF